MSDLRDADTLAEAQKIRQVVQKRPLPASVQTCKLAFVTESTGDLAVTIWLVVGDDPNPSKQILDEVTRYVGETENDLIDLGLRHWPYIRFSPAHEAEKYFP